MISASDIVVTAPDDGSVDGGASEGDVGSSVCLDRGPAACNDNPTVSALWGRCSPEGYCWCNDGFTRNPATGRCRPGTLCMASGADPWPTTVRFDNAECSMRPALPCEMSGGINSAVISYLIATCQVPWHHPVRVELVDGCPTVMNIRAGASGPASPALVACLTSALSGHHWACGGAADCILFERDGVP